MQTIHAIFEDGVFKPVAPVELPKHCEVAFEPRVIQATGENGQSNGGMNRVYEVLDRRFNSGHHDTAERHNEH